MLKFVELCHNLDQSVKVVGTADGPTAETVALWRRQVADGERIIALFRAGALLMDEVDLILHPLKSELNFPIGTADPAHTHTLCPLSPVIDTNRRVVSLVPCAQGPNRSWTSRAAKRALACGGTCRIICSTPSSMPPLRR
jgi:hypothetical protein